MRYRNNQAGKYSSIRKNIGSKISNYSSIRSDKEDWDYSHVPLEKGVLILRITNVWHNDTLLFSCIRSWMTTEYLPLLEAVFTRCTELSGSSTEASSSVPEAFLYHRYINDLLHFITLWQHMQSLTWVSSVDNHLIFHWTLLSNVMSDQYVVACTSPRSIHRLFSSNYYTGWTWKHVCIDPGCSSHALCWSWYSPTYRLWIGGAWGSCNTLASNPYTVKPV